jgi:hypothetical protein
MKREPDQTAETDAPILRRADGTINTEFYADRARGLRNTCIAKALGAAATTRWWRRLAGEQAAKG